MPVMEVVEVLDIDLAEMPPCDAGMIDYDIVNGRTVPLWNTIQVCTEAAEANVHLLCAACGKDMWLNLCLFHLAIKNQITCKVCMNLE